MIYGCIGVVIGFAFGVITAALFRADMRVGSPVDYVDETGA